MDSVYRVIDKVLRHWEITKEELALLKTTVKQFNTIADIAKVCEWKLQNSLKPKLVKELEQTNSVKNR